MSSKKQSKALDPSFNPFLGKNPDEVWAKIKASKRTPISEKEKLETLEVLNIKLRSKS